MAWVLGSFTNLRECKPTLLSLEGACLWWPCPSASAAPSAGPPWCLLGSPPSEPCIQLLASLSAVPLCCAVGRPAADVAGLPRLEVSIGWPEGYADSPLGRCCSSTSPRLGSTLNDPTGFAAASAWLAGTSRGSGHIAVKPFQPFQVVEQQQHEACMFEHTLDHDYPEEAGGESQPMVLADYSPTGQQSRAASSAVTCIKAGNCKLGLVIDREPPACLPEFQSPWSPGTCTGPSAACGPRAGTPSTACPCGPAHLGPHVLHEGSTGAEAAGCRQQRWPARQICCEVPGRR